MEESNLNDQINEEKTLILNEFLKNAPFDRWSNSNLTKSSQACGFTLGYELLLFPNGVDDLIQCFSQRINDLMVQEFTNHQKEHSLRTHEKIAYLVELRFRLYKPYREAIRCLVQYHSMPCNILKSKKLLWQTCDHIWYLAGDRSTDFNYYSKRSLLAMVYSSSLLYWLEDNSKDNIDTKEFIDNRLKNVMKIGQWKSKLKSLYNRLLHND